jgi:hypothetical protein
MLVHIHEAEDRTCDGCGHSPVICDVRGKRSECGLSLCQKCFRDFTDTLVQASARINNLKQLARALHLDIDVLYLWGRVLPSDIRVEGLSEDTIKEAWRAFREVIERERRVSCRRV